MQVIFLPSGWTIALCFVVWAILQLSTSLFCLYLPDKYFSPTAFFFRSHRWEKEGRFYEMIFRVNLWKHLLPDGAAAAKKRGYKKKTLSNFSDENLNRFLVESVRGEVTHWLAILPFWVFGFFAPPEVIWYMLLYATFINFPCILVQRYNRPRVQHLIKRLQCRSI